ncbi:MAG: DUF6754 domain-containing protein [Phycisphaerales bacterium]
MSHFARSVARCRVSVAVAALLAAAIATGAMASPPTAAAVTAIDAPGDAGGRIVVTWKIDNSASHATTWSVERLLDDKDALRELRTRRVAAGAAARDQAIAKDVAARGLKAPDAAALAAGDAAAREAVRQFVVPADGVWVEVGAVAGDLFTATIEGLPKDEPIQVRVVALGSDGSRGQPVAAAAPVVAATNLWFFERTWFFVFFVALCATIVSSIALARRGHPARIRRIAGLDAIDEAIGRATEMGRPVLFIPGIQDMDNVQTVAGVTVLERVARTAAEYDARIEVPTARSLVMTACRDAVQGAYLAAGRGDAYNPDLINYITDEQFGYVAWVASRMRREKPATCIYMGQFYAESLLLAENGNAIGAIQVAGTAETSQLPFFVAACDYTLIGEEFFAASAYLSGEQTQLGSLRGQDVGKALTALIVILGIALATIAALTGSKFADRATTYLRDVVLKG